MYVPVGINECKLLFGAQQREHGVEMCSLHVDCVLYLLALMNAISSLARMSLSAASS